MSDFFGGHKRYTLLPAAEETDRQQAQQHIKEIRVYREQFLSTKQHRSSLCTPPKDIVTYYFTASGKHLRDKIYLYADRDEQLWDKQKHKYFCMCWPLSLMCL